MNFKKWLESTEIKKPEIVVLVGPPAVGKSTYIANKFKHATIISRDDIVDQVAESMGLTYDDMFQLPPQDAEIGSIISGKENFGLVLKAPSYMGWTKVVYENIQKANDLINKKLEEKFKNAVNSNRDIVVDMTNMTIGARKNALKYVKDKDYSKRAVVFSVNQSNVPELLNRMKERSDKLKEQGKTKTIGEDVVLKMMRSFQKVTADEGFDKIELINNFI